MPSHLDLCQNIKKENNSLGNSIKIEQTIASPRKSLINNKASLQN
jgi:hypothetical protein